MRLVLHRKVYSDVDAIMAYYERIARRELADDFYAELRRSLLDAAERPESFPIRERDLRRIVPSFPIPFFVSYRWRCRARLGHSPPSEASHIGRPPTMNRRLTRRWSERRTGIRSTLEMNSTLPLRAMRALISSLYLLPLRALVYLTP